MWQKEFRTKVALALDSRVVRALSAVTTYSSARECFEKVPEINHPPWDFGDIVPGRGFDKGKPFFCKTTPKLRQWAGTDRGLLPAGSLDVATLLWSMSLTAWKWAAPLPAAKQLRYINSALQTHPPLAWQCCSQTVPSTLCRGVFPSQKLISYTACFCLSISSEVCSFWIAIIFLPKPHHCEVSKDSAWQSTTFGMLLSRINTKVC